MAMSNRYSCQMCASQAVETRISDLQKCGKLVGFGLYLSNELLEEVVRRSKFELNRSLLSVF